MKKDFIGGLKIIPVIFMLSYRLDLTVHQPKVAKKPRKLNLKNTSFLVKS